MTDNRQVITGDQVPTMTDKSLDVGAFQINKAVEAARELFARCELLVLGEDREGEPTDDDLQTVRDTFDGATTLDQVIRSAMLANKKDDALIPGLKAAIADFRGLIEKAQKRVEVRRGAIEQAMIAVGWIGSDKGLKFDIGRCTIGKKAPTIEIDDESQIPSQFFIEPPKPAPELDKPGLKKLLSERHKAIQAANEIRDEAARKAKLKEIDLEFPEIDGCHLVTDAVQLTISMK